MKQGDIIIVKFPYSNMHDYKTRPAIIVSNDQLNQTQDYWLCPITTQPHYESIPLEGSITEGKLDKKSYAKTNTITTIEQSNIHKRIGAISKEKLSEIIEAIKSNL